MSTAVNDQPKPKSPKPKESQQSTIDAENRVIKGVEHIERLSRECAEIEEDIKKKIEEKPEVTVDNSLYWTITTAYASVALLLLVMFAVFLLQGGNLNLFGITLRHIGVVGSILILGHILLLSIGSVRLDEWAGLTFFGRPVRIYKEAGPALKLWGIFKFVHEPRVTYNDQFPGPPEKIVRFKSTTDGSAADSEKYADGQIRPIFVPTGPPTVEERMMISRLVEEGLVDESAVLFKQFTVDVRFTVLWRIEDLFLFERVIPGDEPEEKQREIRSRLREIGEAELKEIMRTLTPATTIQCWESIGRRLALRLRKIALDWGVWIDRVALGEMNLSHETNATQAAAIRSAFTKIKTIRDAEAARAKLALEGRGEAEAIESKGHANAQAEFDMLSARAEGMEQMTTRLGVDGKTVLDRETVTSIAENAQYSVYGASNGVSDILGAVSMVKAVPPASGPNPGPTKAPENPPPQTDKTPPSKNPGKTKGK